MDIKSEASAEVIENCNNQQVIRKLECPFTWDFEDILKYEEEYQKKKIENYGDEEKKGYEVSEDYNYESYYPLVMLMNKVVCIYITSSLKEQVNMEKILDIIKIGDEYMRTLSRRNDPEISLEVADHIFLATQFFVYQKFNMIDEMSRVSDLIDNINYDNKKDKSTLLGCKSLCRLRYNRVDLSKAEEFIREALKENPNCHLWYYTLATIIRRRRKDSSIISKPSDEEVANFNKAYELSPNPMYEICIAQTYKELWDLKKARKMYIKLYENLPEDNLILLRLALGFTHQKDFRRAKVCLDKVEQSYYVNSMYMHYKGIYYFKQRMYKDAVPYFKEAIKKHNIAADKDFLRCMLKIDRDFLVTDFLLSLLKKYDAIPEEQIQPIFIDLALCYWKKDDNIFDALNYFLQGIKIKPDAICISNYYDYLNIGVEKNIFVELKKNFLPTIQQQQWDQDSAIFQKSIELQKCCDNYFVDIGTANDALNNIHL